MEVAILSARQLALAGSSGINRVKCEVSLYQHDESSSSTPPVRLSDIVSSEYGTVNASGDVVWVDAPMESINQPSYAPNMTRLKLTVDASKLRKPASSDQQMFDLRVCWHVRV